MFLAFHFNIENSDFLSLFRSIETLIFGIACVYKYNSLLHVLILGMHYLVVKDENKKEELRKAAFNLE
jgi:hypothetical protein